MALGLKSLDVKFSSALRLSGAAEHDFRQANG